MKKIIITFCLATLSVLPLSTLAAVRPSTLTMMGICDMPQPMQTDISSRIISPERSYNFTFPTTYRLRTDIPNMGDFHVFPRTGIPFGFWGLNGYQCQAGYNDIQNRFNVNSFTITSTGPTYNLNDFLPPIESADMEVNLNITGSYADFDDESGNFDLSLAEAAVDTYFADSSTAAAMQTYIDNGTVNSIMLMDDIYNYEGDAPTAEELEEFACAIKDNIDVTIWFREDLDNLIKEDSAFQFDCVDAVGLQYSYVKDPSVEDWAEEQYDLADDLNLDIIYGLNIADGGDGSSGIQGYRGAGFYVMSAAEITEYGEYLLDYAQSRTERDLKMFYMWEYDDQEYWADGVTKGTDIFDQIAYREAISDLGDLVADYEL